MMVVKAVLVAYFAVFATAYALLAPPFEAPDEPAHLAYVNFVAARGELPNQYDQKRALVGQGPSPTEGHQPPLYYALAALLVRPFSAEGCSARAPAPNPLHAWNGGTREDVPLFEPEWGGLVRSAQDRTCLLALRGLPVLLGVANVAAALVLSRAFFSGWWHLMPAVLMATLPQFQFTSGVVSNDALVNLSSTLCILCAFRVLAAPERRAPYLWLGAALGVALLSKKTALFLLPVVVGLVAYVMYRRRDARPRIAGSTAGMVGVALLVSGWWFVRNYALYGDPLATEMQKQTLGGLVQEKSLFSEYFGGAFRRKFTQSLIGMFGWMQVQVPGAVYWLYGLLAGAAAIGAALRTPAARIPAANAVLAAGFVVSCFAGIVAYNLTYSQPQGRFLFPVLPLLGVLLTGGVRELLGRVPAARPVPVLAGCIVGGLVVADVASLMALVSFYGAPSLPS